MAKQGRFVHVVKKEDDVTGVALAFDASKFHEINLNSVLATYHQNTTRWSGFIEGVVIKLSSISSATKLTVRGTMDDETVLPDTEADINLNIGSTTVGSVVFKAGLAWASRESDSLKIYCKADAGSVTIDEVMVCWSE